MAKYCADCEYINTNDKKCDGIYIVMYSLFCWKNDGVLG